MDPFINLLDLGSERKARLKKMVGTKRLKLAMETDEKRKARLEKMVATSHLRLALETEEERKAKNGLDLIWIEIKSRNEPARPVMGTISSRLGMNRHYIVTYFLSCLWTLQLDYMKYAAYSTRHRTTILYN